MLNNRLLELFFTLRWMHISVHFSDKIGCFDALINVSLMMYSPVCKLCYVSAFNKK